MFKTILSKNFLFFQTQEVTCESHKSNPAPELQWYLGGRQLREAEQTNETEPNGDRRYKATSILKHAFTHEDYGQSLVCRVNHPAYPTGFQEAAVALDLLCQFILIYSVSLSWHKKLVKQIDTDPLCARLKA